MREDNVGRRDFLKKTTSVALAFTLAPGRVLGGIDVKNQGATSINNGTVSDLKRIMEMGGQNMLDCCNPERNYLPYFTIPDPGAVAKDIAWNHNIGRWFDSLLRLEDTIGWKIPAERLEIMENNLRKFCENPDSLPFGPRDGWLGIKPDFYLHSLREYILAVNSLVRYRKSSWAEELGHRMLETIRRASTPEGKWILTEFDTYVNLPVKKPNEYMPHGTSDRLVEALVLYYQTTGDPLSIDLADCFARYHLKNSCHPDGTLNVDSLQGAPTGHTHSYLGGQRGLLLFGELTGQHEYIDTVLATYKVTVRRIVRESGYANHDLEQIPGKVTSIPECSSPGDAAQLAMWLALRCGHTGFLDDAERWIRARIVPGQITEDQAIDQNGILDRRFLGGWGASHEPQGAMMSYPDVTAAVLHTLCDIYKHIVICRDSDLTVNFHFNYDDKNVSILSKRTNVGTVTIKPKKLTNVRIRIPRWAPPESVHLLVCGQAFQPKIIGDFAYVPRMDMSEHPEIVLTYGLPERTTIDMINGSEYHYQWKGDDITGAFPGSDVRPFYRLVNV